MTGPLSGVRVLDLSRLLPGPACSWYLQGLGAEVDRVEPLPSGDYSRHMPPFVDGVGAFYAALSRGKRSMGLHFRHESGPAAIRALAPAYDVLIEGFKPGVMEAMGIGPAVLHELHPGLVVCRLSGFGQTGPWCHRPGHDINYTGLAGIVAATPQSDGLPVPPAVQIADMSGALVGAMGIAAALYERERDGGQCRVLDVALHEAALSMMTPHIAGMTAEQREMRPGDEMLSGALPIYGTYRCRDGRLLTVGALEPKFQQRIRGAIDSLEREALVEAFAARPRDEWVEILADACVGPALELGELASHPHLVGRGAIERCGVTSFVTPPLRLGSTASGDVPALAEHTQAIFADAGVDPTPYRDAL